MSTRTILVDDLDGTEAFRTIRFSFDGRTFDIDLSREHLDALKHGLEPWMNAAREVSKYAAKPGSPAKRNGKQNAAIREWGRERGMDVPERGLIPRALVVAYEAAHAKPQAA